LKNKCSHCNDKVIEEAISKLFQQLTVKAVKAVKAVLQQQN